VFSGRGICNGPILRPGKSPRLWYFWWVWSWSSNNEEIPAH